MADYDVGKAFSRIEDALIRSMMGNLDRHRAEETKEGIQWEQWQALQLKALEDYKRSNRKVFGERFSVLNGRIEEMMQGAYERGGTEQEVRILKAIQKGLPLRKTPDMATAAFFRLNQRKMDTLIKATLHDMQRAETAVLRMADDKYRKIIFNAQVYANSGAGTYEKAVDMATKDFLSAGLNCIEYKNGARHTISDYADMAVRTASKRAYLQGEGEKRREWGISTVIVNKRGNPCPLCLPFVGKVFIDDVWSGGKAKDGKYPLLSEAIAAGLYHPRCKDSHTTYFPGISTPPKDQQITEEDVEEVRQNERQEARQNYAERQEARFGRLAEYSLDADNKRLYEARRRQWESIKADSENVIFENATYKAVLQHEEEAICSDQIESALLLDRRGKILFKTSSGEAGFVKFTAEQVAVMKGCVLTHNHPRGSTFSADDIALAVHAGLKGIRATGKQRTYQLLLKQNNPNKKDFAMDFKQASLDNKAIVDIEHKEILSKYDKHLISDIEYDRFCNMLNKKLDSLNSDWLKENARNYGYKYSVIDRR